MHPPPRITRALAVRPSAGPGSAVGGDMIIDGGEELPEAGGAGPARKTSRKTRVVAVALTIPNVDGVEVLVDGVVVPWRMASSIVEFVPRPTIDVLVDAAEGDRRIEVRAPNHEPMTRTVRATDGAKVVFALARLPAADAPVGRSVIVARPGIAVVRLNGRVLDARAAVAGDGAIRHQTEMRVGRYPYEVSAPGYVTARGEISVAAGRQTQVDVTLAPDRAADPPDRAAPGGLLPAALGVTALAAAAGLAWWLSRHEEPPTTPARGRRRPA